MQPTPEEAQGDVLRRMKNARAPEIELLNIKYVTCKRCRSYEILRPPATYRRMAFSIRGFQRGSRCPPASPWTVWQPPAGGAFLLLGECRGGQWGQRVCGEGMASGGHPRRHTFFCFWFLFFSANVSACAGEVRGGGAAPRNGRRGCSHGPHFPWTWMPSGAATMQVVTMFMKSPCSTTPSSARIASAAALASLMGSFSKYRSTM